VGAGFHVLPGKGDEEFRGSLGIDQGYVLSHGPAAGEARALIAAWTWVDRSVGDYVPLVICGIDDDAARALEKAAEDLGVQDPVRVLPDAAPDRLPALYRGAQVHAARQPQGNRSGFPLGDGMRRSSCGASKAAGDWDFGRCRLLGGAWRYACVGRCGPDAHRRTSRS
jgi:hypothetical protein